MMAYEINVDTKTCMKGEIQTPMRRLCSDMGKKYDKNVYS